jgi:hypothetical protein
VHVRHSIVRRTAVLRVLAATPEYWYTGMNTITENEVSRMIVVVVPDNDELVSSTIPPLQGVAVIRGLSIFV